MSGDRSKRMPPAEMAESPSLSVRNRYWHTRISEQEKELERMRAVYDAAMALVQHEIDMMEQGVKNPTDWDKYYDALHDACRRAKEGK